VAKITDGVGAHVNARGRGDRPLPMLGFDPRKDEEPLLTAEQLDEAVKTFRGTLRPDAAARV
jgi:hypothetical protein